MYVSIFFFSSPSIYSHSNKTKNKKKWDSRFDIHLLTLSTKTERRTIKSWFNLTTTNDSLTVKVTDDWFPTTLPNNASNKTWIIYAFLLGQSPLEPLTDSTAFISNTSISDSDYVDIRVVRKYY